MSRHYAEIDRPLAAILADLPEGASHLVLTGPYGPASETRRWLETGGATVTRCESTGEVNARVGALRIGSMAGWIGREALTAGEARDLHRELCDHLCRSFQVRQVALVSPAVCGRNLWREEIGDAAPPPLSPADQSLIRHETCQRREEILTLPGVESVDEVQVWDGRFMYGALCEKLPIGPAVRHGGLNYLPSDYVGRVRVRFRVPEEWRHVGLLAVKGTRSAWEWPSRPGAEGECWCDASEARLAKGAGWDVTVLEGLQMQEGRPLDGWVRRLVGLWERTREIHPRLSRCARAILLQTVGDFQGVGRVEQREASFVSGPRVRVPRAVRLAVDPARAAVSHPEWCAAIWSRCRLRMVKAMLRMPRADLLAIRTDALYLTSGFAMPADDGRAGRLRLKQLIRGPIPAPRSDKELKLLLLAGGE